MWWRRCTSPLTGSTASGGLAMKSWARCMPRLLGDFLFCWTAIVFSWLSCGTFAFAVGMARREREREHEFVFDERDRIDRPLRQHDLEAAVGVERGELAFVAREQDLGGLVDRPFEIGEAALAHERHRTFQSHAKRGAAGRIGDSLDSPRDRR